MQLGDLRRAQIEEARWRILAALDTFRAGHLTETMLHKIVADQELHLSQMELRNELVYLEDRRLLHVKDRKAETWLVQIGHHGTDIVQYTVDCQPGIARPPR